MKRSTTKQEKSKENQKNNFENLIDKMFESEFIIKGNT